MYKYEDAIDIIIDKFPALKLDYERDADYYKGLPYVFYESVFVKYLLYKIALKEEKELLLIFNLLEKFLLKGDKELQNLVEVAVIERLFYEENYKDFCKYISQFYGSLTQKSFNDCLK